MAIDAHYPAQEDALALQIVARDYVPVLAEEGQLLLRREPRADADTRPQGADARPQGADARYQGADARHPIELEAGIGFGETLELAPGREGCRLLRIDVAETTLGKLLRFLENAPPLRAEFVLDSGETFRATLSPAMIRAGFLFDPCLRSASDWVTWFTGGALPRPIRLRIEAPDSPSRYGERLRVQVLRADDLVPRARPDLADEALFSLFREQPSAHRAAGPPAMRTLRGRDVLLLRAPSELRFDVAAGEHALTARFGILASEWQAGCPGGARFRAVLEVPGGDALVVFEKDVDPVRIEIDRRLKYLDVRFVAPAAGTLSLRTEPGTGGGTPCTETVWTDVAID